MKTLLVSRRKLSILACGLGAALMLAVVNAPAVLTASAAQRQLPIYCVARDQKMCAVSFDAAWGDVILRQIRREG